MPKYHFTFVFVNRNLTSAVNQSITLLYFTFSLVAISSILLHAINFQVWKQRNKLDFHALTRRWRLIVLPKECSVNSNCWKVMRSSLRSRHTYTSTVYSILSLVSVSLDKLVFWCFLNDWELCVHCQLL